MTLATIDVDGDFALFQNGEMTSIRLGGAFAGDASGLVGTDFDMPMDYIFGASLTFGGFTIFDGTLPVDDRSLNEVIGLTLGLLGDLDDDLGGVPLAFFLDLLDDGEASIDPFLFLFVDIDDFVLGASGFSGLFDIESFLPFSDPACAEGGDEWTVVPCNLKASFALELSISKEVAAVPLPAGAPLLLLGLGGLAALRRRAG